MKDKNVVNRLNDEMDFPRNQTSSKRHLSTRQGAAYSVHLCNESSISSFTKPICGFGRASLTHGVIKRKLGVKRRLNYPTGNYIASVRSTEGSSFSKTFINGCRDNQSENLFFDINIMINNVPSKKSQQTDCKDNGFWFGLSIILVKNQYFCGEIAPIDTPHE